MWIGMGCERKPQQYRVVRPRGHSEWNGEDWQRSRPPEAMPTHPRRDIEHALKPLP